jgi:alkylated DNA nucleotide flippase Atl1
VSKTANGVTPYWRVVKDNGTFNPKLPGGVAQQTLNLRHEGLEVSATGKKNPRVVDFANRLIKFK